MIELVLFTQPGERVMRPDFGTGLLRFVHAANSPELAAALRLTVQAALSQFLGDVVDVRDLRVEAIDAELRVTLSYALRATGEARTDTFVRGAS
jgi:phage baseplate assembly protein W